MLRQDDAKVDMSSVFAKQQEHREAEARQRLAILRAMNDQQKALAETINVSVDEIKDALVPEVHVGFIDQHQAVRRRFDQTDD